MHRIKKQIFFWVKGSIIKIKDQNKFYRCNSVPVMAQVILAKKVGSQPVNVGHA